MMTYRVGAIGNGVVAGRAAAHLLEPTQTARAAEIARAYSLDPAAPDGLITTAIPRRDLHPELARALGIDPGRALNYRETASLLNGRRTDGQVIAERSTNATNAYIDFCFSADKSVSAAWALAPTDAERAVLLQAHTNAVTSAMRYIEREIAAVTHGRNGEGGRTPGRLAWVAFTHCTSRPTLAVATDAGGQESLTTVNPMEAVPPGVEPLAVRVPGDPNLHTHVAVPNLVLGNDGKLGALHLQQINGRVLEFGAVYQAHLAANLRRAGIAVKVDRTHGTARIAGIPRKARDAFSKRTRDAHQHGREFAERRGVDWDRLPDAERIRFLKTAAHMSRRAPADDIADFAAWRDQAKALGWEPRSVIGPAPLLSPETEIRRDRGYEESLGYLESAFQMRSVVMASDVRLAAARGLIEAGIEDNGDGGGADVDAVTARMRERGVRQDGRMTDLIWGRQYTERGQELVKITTALHEDQEKEVIELARTAAADTSRALNREALDAAVARTGIRFDGTHGASQRAMMERLAEGGRLVVGIGAAGSGKTRSLEPLVDAWKHEGRSVYGATLAWRQTEGLKGAGIDDDKRLSLAAFLYRVKHGKLLPDANSVVVVDEVGLLGARQTLDLLRLQKEHGFAIVGLGDERQCQAVEAGPALKLLRHALGNDAIPEIAGTIRQKGDREREIATLFRTGAAETALGMKRADGTALAVPGDKAAVIARIADLWSERMAANAHRPDFSLSASAPTNEDARLIGAAIRERRRAMGQVGVDLADVPATDQQGARYDLRLAVGDRVRLFDRVYVNTGNGGGRLIGVNGSVVEVAGIGHDGITLKSTGGTVGSVSWDSLRAKDGPGQGRIRLTYGDAGTIDSQQGITSTEHINALPSGSAAVSLFKGYVAESRHREVSWLVTSEQAERRDISSGRPIGSTQPITQEDVWRNIARNLSRTPEKALAIDFLEKAEGLRQGMARRRIATQQVAEQRALDGLEPWTLGDRLETAREQAGLQSGMSRLGAAVVRRAAAARDLSRRMEAMEQALADLADETEDMTAGWLESVIGDRAPEQPPITPMAEIHAKPANSDSKPNHRPARAVWAKPAKREAIPEHHLRTLKESVRLSDLIRQTVSLDRNGTACCPFRDEKTASFTVEDKKGFYHCFGCGTHGDAIDWLKEKHGMTFREAIAYLEDSTGKSLSDPKITPVMPQAEKPPEWRAVPVPAGAPALIGPSGRTVPVFNPKRAGTAKEYARYRPAHIAEYRDEHGRHHGTVLRVEIPDPEGRKARKFTPQVTWVVPYDTPKNADLLATGRWALWSMAGPRPLYHAELLTRNPEAPVIVVSGEKKADALQKVMGQAAVVVSWVGGDHGRHHADFRPLRGRDVTVWPDADTSGRMAALGSVDERGAVKEGAVSLITKAGAARVALVEPPTDVVKGWDCGDLVKQGGGIEAVYDFLDQHVTDPKGLAPVRQEIRRPAPERTIDIGL